MCALISRMSSARAGLAAALGVSGDALTAGSALSAAASVAGSTGAPPDSRYAGIMVTIATASPSASRRPTCVSKTSPPFWPAANRQPDFENGQSEQRRLKEASGMPDQDRVTGFTDKANI